MLMLLSSWQAHRVVLILATALLCWCLYPSEGWPAPSSSRRKWLEQTVFVLVTTTTLPSPPGYAADSLPPNELPLVLRDFTKLAPLGKRQGEGPSDKTLHLSLNNLAARLATDLTEGRTGQGGYFISGDLDDSVFRDDCVFVDPTNRVDSLTQYRNALRILFDPTQSQVQLVQGPQVNEKDRTIEVTIRSRGVLQLPWRPYITAYESHILYSIDEGGLISQQAQTWSKSASAALQESFSPSLFRPAPQSTLPPGQNEPAKVSELFNYVNGRRPYEYTQRERFEISRLIDQIIADEQQAQDKATSFRPELLPGNWMLVYLQPGPTGIGIDRRVPFSPEFDFNDNFQIFSRHSVVNVGQVLGPLIQVRVQGDLREETPGDYKVPKRLIAQINGGEICWKEQDCLDLPIKGEGLFDSVFLGERLRIGQNINGGRARVVQVKLE
jgi:hypothetical protein